MVCDKCKCISCKDYQCTLYRCCGMCKETGKYFCSECDAYCDTEIVDSYIEEEEEEN